MSNSISWRIFNALYLEVHSTADILYVQFIITQQMELHKEQC